MAFTKRPHIPHTQRGRQLVGKPVAFYPFSEYASSTIFDISGNGINGPLTGSYNWTGSKFGTVLDFDGSTAYADMGDVDNFDGATELTVFARVKFDDIGVQHLVSKGRTSDNSFWMATAGDGDAIEISITDTFGSQYRTVVANSIETGIWYDIAAVWHGGKNVDFYINGIEREQIVVINNSPISIKNSAEHFMLGAQWMTGLPSKKLDGMMAEARVYTRALTHKEVSMIGAGFG